MPTFIHPTISIVSNTERAPGKSDTASLKSLFPGAPGSEEFAGSGGSNSYKQLALGLLLGGEVSENLQAGVVDRDFGANASDESRRPPSLAAVPTGGGGLPASPWVPNPVSPGVGSTDPKDQVAAPESFGRIPTNSMANIGSSTDATQPSRDPATSSQRMSQTRDAYVPGKSPATANAS